VHVDAPAWWFGREEEAFALLARQAARDLSLDAIDQSLRIGKRLPQPCGPVIGGGQEVAAVGRKHRAEDLAGVAAEGGERLAVVVPQPRSVVLGGGQDAAAVGRERRAVNFTGVAREGDERHAVMAHKRAILSSEAVRNRELLGANTALSRLGELAYNPRTQRYNVCFALIVSPISGPIEAGDFVATPPYSPSYAPLLR
jgi:hypothetical protein